MQNLLEELQTLLASQPRFTHEGRMVKQAVIDAAQSLAAELLRLFSMAWRQLFRISRTCQRQLIFLDNIQAAVSEGAPLSLWQTLQAEAFISYKVTPDLIDKNAADFGALGMEVKKCFWMEALKTWCMCLTATWRAGNPA